MQAVSGWNPTNSAESSNYRILVVEDSEAIQEIVAAFLSKAGYQHQQVGTGAAARRALDSWNPDLVVLDLGLPDVDGMDLCGEIRSASDALVLILTGRDEEDSRFAGLQGGADAYVAKPFSKRELLVPIEVLFRRRKPNQNESSTLELDDIRLDRSTRRIWVGGHQATLTKIEAAILGALIEADDHVVSKDQLLAVVWGPDWIGDHHVVRVHVANLRKKMSDDGQSRIVTLRGIGYQLLGANERLSKNTKVASS